MYYLQLNGKVIYNWRPQTVFDLLQQSILPLGYQLKASGQERIGNALAESIRRFWRKVQGTKDGKKTKKIKNRDLGQAGHKTGGDQANTFRHVGRDQKCRGESGFSV